jgi:hypothetical protein
MAFPKPGGNARLFADCTRLAAVALVVTGLLLINRGSA